MSSLRASRSIISLATFCPTFFGLFTFFEILMVAEFLKIGLDRIISILVLIGHMDSSMSYWACGANAGKCHT
jgi:hypothetical protein